MFIELGFCPVIPDFCLVGSLILLSLWSGIDASDHPYKLAEFLGELLLYKRLITHPKAFL